MSTMFVANKANVCARCPRPIEKGTKVLLNDDGEIVHLGCDDAEDLDNLMQRDGI